ncbi:MAG: Ig-like domain-containing protein [Chitinophagaceae bacterium]|nr:Ig-like domain-containing protein [Chitinophagaceae bacterium]
MTAPMKPTVQNILTTLFGNSGRRRKVLSALVIGLLFIVGVPAGAAGQCSTPGSCSFIITVTQDNQIADGVHSDLVRIKVIDNVTGLPVPSLSISMKLGSGTATIPGSTDASGVVIFPVQNTVAGTVDLKFYVNTGTPPYLINNATTTVNFIVGPPNVNNPETKLVVDKGTATADGMDKTTIHAHIVDKTGNILVNTSVTISFFVIPSGAADANAVLSTVATKTDANGDIYLDITDITSGTVLLGATVNGQTIIYGSPASVQFVAGPPDVTRPETRLVVDVPQAPADGATPTKIHAHLVDKNGNVVTMPVDISFFVIPSGPADATAQLSGGGTSVTPVNGDISLTITNTKTGIVQLGAKVTVNGVTSTITNGSPAPVKFVSDVPDVTKSETKLVVDIPIATADGSSITKIHAHLVDKNGNLVNVPVDISFFIIPSGAADATAVLVGGGNGLTPDANGDLYLTITNTKVGTVQLGATVDGKTITFGSPAPVKFVDNTPDPSSPQNILIVDIGQATADGTSITKIHAHLVNLAGAPAKNALVDLDFFIIPSGGPEATAVLTMIGGPNPVMTDGNGDVFLTITNTKVGAVQLGAKFHSGPTITNGSPAIVKFISGGAVPTAPGVPNGTMLSIVRDFAPADGTSMDSVLAHITDKNGNPVADTTVTFSIRAGGTSTATAQLIGTVQVKTDANGNAYMRITNTVAGTVWIDASIIYNGNPTALIDGSYKEITFTNIPDVTNSATRLIVIVYEALADGQSTTVVKAHVVDQNGDPLPMQEVKFTIDSGTAQIITPGPWKTDMNGDVSIELTSTKPGFALITATVNVSGVDKAITFGSPARVRFAAINIYVPKVFTPNGDGMNDVLKPILVGISTFHYFNVYNRWGNLIFTTQDPNYGWDGRFKGVPQPVETYLWIAEGIDINGKKIVAKGMTSLVK